MFICLSTPTRPFWSIQHRASHTVPKGSNQLLARFYQSSFVVTHLLISIMYQHDSVLENTNRRDCARVMAPTTQGPPSISKSHIAHTNHRRAAVLILSRRASQRDFPNQCPGPLVYISSRQLLLVGAGSIRSWCCQHWIFPTASSRRVAKNSDTIIYDIGSEPRHPILTTDTIQFLVCKNTIDILFKETQPNHFI